MIPTMIHDVAGAGGRDRVSAAIQLASARTGVDFDYLFNQARIESSLNPNARARTSSATGLFQFIDQTWLGMVKQHGAEHGMGWAADAIRRGANGRYYVADPEMRRAVLDLRKQPEASSAMAAEFASDNRRYLERRLGRPVESVDLYLAHFLGAGGAARFLAAHDANPAGAAAASVPAAARANRWVFYNRDGSPRSFAQIRERFASRIGGGAAPARGASPNPFPEVRTASLDTGAALDSAARARPLAGPSQQYARLAYLMLAQIGD
jgi:transglycosylase-like protein with SLT domain